MALFQKNPIELSENSAPLYKVEFPGSPSDEGPGPLLIVGLGNPGKEYAATRHNIGFEILDSFAANQDFPAWTTKKSLSCLYTNQEVGKTQVILCKPTTFMNESGRAVQAIQHFYKIPNLRTLVIYDELAIKFGQIRTRIGGSSAGHNGVKSISSQSGQDYGRVRIGIGPKKPKEIDSADFVLAKFSKEEKSQLPKLLQETNALLGEYIHGGGLLLAETRSFTD